MSSVLHLPKMFLDVLSAVEFAGVTLRCFRGAIARNEISPIPINKKFFFLARDVQTWKSEKAKKKKKS